MKRSIVLIPVLALLGGVNAKADPWNESNNPSTMDKNYEYRFSALPTEADLITKPWAETYWETAKGSINIRWNLSKPVGFKYDLHSREELMRMSRQELSTLSPSEKYDILLGRYDYPLHKEVSSFASPYVAAWKGLCNGWSMSAIQYEEPKPVDVTNPDGIVIPFGSSDLKGLLSYAAQMKSNVHVDYVGGQCRGLVGRIFGGPDCADINPGAMHVILTNQLGLRNQAFMMDRDPKAEIWNQPVFGYRTTVLGSAKSDAAQGIRVHTTVFYTDEMDNSSWVPTNGTALFKSDKIEMDYILDLDYAGRIVGGKYVEKSDHPDLFWKPSTNFKMENDFSKLNELVQLKQ